MYMYVYMCVYICMYIYVYIYVYIYIGCALLHAEAPGPGIKPTPQ